MLVYACIAPHGDELIPALAGDELRRFAPLRRGMRALARQMEEARPDTIIVATPHNLRLHGNIAVGLSQHSSGSVSGAGRRISLSADCDVGLAWKILAEAERRRLPVVGANYGTFEGRLSDLAMDWGTLIPMWFFRERRLKSRLVMVAPSREIELKENFEFGRAVARVAAREKRRVAFVASADQAHAHRRDGPYGFSPQASAYDRAVIEAVTGGDLRAVLKIPPSLVEAAKPDSLWQMTMLAGVLEEARLTGSLHAYDVPTYYGMLCAGYTLPRRH